MQKPIYPFAIHSVAFNPDGRLVAGADGAGLLRIWDVASGQLRHEIPAHTNWVFSIAWSQDGTSFFTGGGDDLIHQFDTGNPTKPRRTFRGHTNDVHAVALTRDGKTMVSAGDDRQVLVWDLERGEVVRTLAGHERQIPTLAISPDQTLIASGSRDHTIRLWDLRSSALRDVLIGHTGDLMSVRFSPDGLRLASGGWDYTVRLWDVRTGKAVRVLLGNPNWVAGVAFSPDGQRLAAASGSTLRLLDVASGKEVWAIKHEGKISTPNGPVEEDLSTVVFSAEGRTLAVGSTIGAVYLIGTDSGEILRELKAEK